MEDLFRPTLSNMGFEITTLDEISKAFIDFAINRNGWALEIGSAFGNTASIALKSGVNLYCNDLSKEHLDMIRINNQEHKDRLTLLEGDFLSCNYDRQFDAILISRVLHFLSPEKVFKAFELFCQLLTDIGKLFITVETPFLANWSKYLPVYMKKKTMGDSFAGYITNAIEYESSGYSTKLPKEVNWFDTDLMDVLAKKYNFTLEVNKYLNRKGIFPDDLILDGRESVAVIMRKN